MNKEALIDEMTRNSKLTREQAKEAINAFTEAIGTALSQNNKVVLVGFGTFEPYQRTARMGRNPQNGDLVKIPAVRVAKFSAGKTLKGVVARHGRELTTDR